jgi:hypothetical protein
MAAAKINGSQFMNVNATSSNSSVILLLESGIYYQFADSYSKLISL